MPAYRLPIATDFEINIRMTNQGRQEKHQFLPPKFRCLHHLYQTPSLSLLLPHEYLLLFRGGISIFLTPSQVFSCLDQAIMSP
jgi:hypothetical protein